MSASELLTAIERRKQQWDMLRRKRTPPSKREQQILATLQEKSDAAKAWILLTRSGGKSSCEIDHDEVLRLLLRSADLAEETDTSAFSSTAIEKRFSELKQACSLLIDHYCAEAGVYAAEIDFEEPLDPGKPWVFKCVYQLWSMMDDLVVEECCALGPAIWTPHRTTIKGEDGAARLFEHAFSTYLRRGFGRPFDEFVLDMSRLVFPSARALEDTRTLLKFRQIERERHTRMMNKFLGRGDLEEGGHSIKEGGVSRRPS